MALRMWLVIAIVGLLFGGLAIYSKTPEPVDPATDSEFHGLSGKYGDNRGGALYIEIDDAGRLEGFYEHGETFGELYGRLDANTFSGYWLEDGAPMTCENERHGAETWGRLRWTFSDGGEFVGAYSYCGSDPSAEMPWTGVRLATR